jgi:pyruvate dehydrogenase E2 component (dihydrolipoamide acetyltransferase)
LHRLTPRARRLLAQAGLSLADLEQLPAGRVTAAAIQELVARRRTEADPAEERESGELVPMSKAQRVVAARMTASVRDVPQFSLRFQAWMDHLLALQPRLAGGGERLTLNDLLLRAVAIALSRSPAVQYQYREEGIWHPGGVHIGFAVASGAGSPGGEELLVPVIRHADRKRVAEIGREAAALAARVRGKRQRPEDLAGGTFTVSNLGMFGITSFVPIINPGEGAILGVGALQETPRVRGGSIVSARVVELTLVCDHRSVNGATGAAFCAELKKVLEAEEVGSW